MTTSSDASGPAIRALRELGFSELEARIYAHLLVHSPTTGYRISHEIGKPVANTYKAITELARRGALQIDEGGSRQVRAVPVEELLGQLEREAGARRQSAAEALRELAPAAPDDRVYTLATTRQVLERARAMIGRAQKIIVGDISPQPFAEIRTALEHASRRVTVAAKVYEKVEPDPKAKTRKLSRLDLVPAVDSNLVFDAWPGQQLSLVVDAREHLLALLSDDLHAVHQAIWSNSTYLSCMQHNHVAIEIEYTRLHADRHHRPAGSTLLLTARPPGLRDLQARFAAAKVDPKNPPAPQATPSSGGSR